MDPSQLDAIFDSSIDRPPDERELVEAAMQWHFGPESASPFWLARAKTLDFDPRRDVHTLADLRRFPNVADALRDVRARDLIPRGYGARPDVASVCESGGTMVGPERIFYFDDRVERWLDWFMRNSDLRNHPRDVDWLLLAPTGPHIGRLHAEMARRRGGIAFTVDMDPRWVETCLREGRTDEAERYMNHVLTQAERLMETQDIGVMMTTPALLERVARDERWIKLVNDSVRVIFWSGGHMDPDTRYLLRTEIFPRVTVHGAYGSSTILGGAVERLGLSHRDPCIFDTFSPYTLFSVVDPKTGEPVAYGERGQVVMHHIGKCVFVPNDVNGDGATRITPPPGRLGDSVADVARLAPMPACGEALAPCGAYR